MENAKNVNVFYPNPLEMISNETQHLMRNEPIYSFFGDHDLKHGNYKLVGIGMEGQQINGFKNFSIDDSNTLVEMQKKWVFDHKINAMSCGFDYEIQLLKEKKLVYYCFIDCHL